MRDKNILIYSPSFAQWGGGHIYIENLCKYLQKNGFSPLMLTAKPEYFNCNSQKLYKVISKFSRAVETLKLAFKYRKEYKVVLLNDLTSIWLSPIFKILGYRVYSLLHIYLRLGDGKGLGHTKFEYIFILLSSKFVDKIFSVNKENINIFGSGKTIFVGNYLSSWFFEKDIYPKKEYDFLLIARFTSQKNIPLFLKLLKELNQRANREFNALIVGEGVEKKNILNKIKEYQLDSVVTIKSWIDREQLPQVYDRGRCFVISSYHEGFATTLLEAHSRGLPAIVTKSSGFCAEFIQNYGGESGIVFEESDLDKDDFYQKVESLVDNSEKFKDLAIKKAKIFTEDLVLGKILKEIE